MAKTTSSLEDTEKYTYNKETDTYITNLKSKTKPLVLSGATHRALVRALSNAISPSLTVEEASLKFRIPIKNLEEYKKVHGITRDSLPLAAEEVEENSVPQSAQELLDAKRFEVSQAFERLSWKDTQGDAEQWRDFQYGTLDPFSTALDSWQPPKLTAKLPVPVVDSPKVLVIGLSDLHYGSKANERYMFRRPGWDTNDTVKAVDKYCADIIRAIGQRKYAFSKVIILGLGDLLHSVLGKTARGTELKYDVIREEQFEYALDSLMVFISRITDAVPNVEVHSVYGNHNYESEMALFRALEKYFTPDKRVKFFHYSSRPAAFKDGSTLFMLDHGADSVERAYVPTGSESKLQQHVQSLLLDIPEMLVDTKTRIFAVGDKHHWEHLEYRDFEFIMFSTILGSDEHSNVNNLKNRARQSCLILDENGLSEVLHVYFN